MELIEKTKIKTTKKDIGNFVKIPSKAIEKLIAYRIPGEQMQCLLFIIRKTYGWNKKEDIISLSQFVEATGINKRNVSRALRELINKKIVIKKDNNTGVSYSFNTTSKNWKALSKKITNKINGRTSIDEIKANIRKRDNNTCMLCGFDGYKSRHFLPVHHIDSNQGNNADNNLITLCKTCHGKSHTTEMQIALSKKITSVIKKDNLLSSKKTHTIDTIQKKLLQKKKTSCIDSDEPTRIDKDIGFSLNNGRPKRIAKFLFRLIQERDRKIKEPDFEKWATYIDKLNRIDNRDFAEIKKVIRWCQQDDFWQDNILSTSKLRKQYPQLRLKMLKEQKQTKRKLTNSEHSRGSNTYKDKNELTFTV